MSPKAIELMIDAAIGIIEAARIVAPAMLASKAAKSSAFRELAEEVTRAVGEPTETEIAADRARQRVGGA